MKKMIKQIKPTFVAFCALLLFVPLLAAQDGGLQVTILSLPEGARLVNGMEIEVEVIADPGVEVAAVELFINDISMGVDTEMPYNFAIQRVPKSSVHRIRAVARSTTGRTAIDTRLLTTEEDSNFAVRVDLVTVYVSVNDQQGTYVRNLTEEDFILEEEGVEQEVAFFTSEVTPLTAAILMDVSSSMIGERIIRSQNAAIDLVRNLIRPEDQAMVLGFDDRLSLYQSPTSEVEKLVEAIRLTGPNGGTALYDAVAGTTRRLFNLPGKRAIIVLSDGDDTDSDFSGDEVLDYLQKSSVILYSVGLQTLTTAQTRVGETRKTIHNLREMAEFSGGQAYFPSFISHLPGIYAAIGKDLSSQYTIAYYPKNAVRDGSWRTIRVRVKGQDDLSIRHRKGYYAN